MARNKKLNKYMYDKRLTHGDMAKMMGCSRSRIQQLSEEPTAIIVFDDYGDPIEITYTLKKVIRRKQDE